MPPADRVPCQRAPRKPLLEHLSRDEKVHLPATTDMDCALLACWVGATSALLRPLVDAICKHVLAAAKLHADDTPVPVPGNGKTKTGRLWTYVWDVRPAGDLSPCGLVR
jgi:transposase